MFKRKLPLALAVMLGMVMSVAAPAHAEIGVTDSTITFGSTVPLSGPLAPRGVDFMEGAEAWFKTVNNKGGVNGRKIQLVKLDDTYKPEIAAANAKKLVKEDNSFMIFGGVGAAPTIAVNNALADSGVPIFAPYTGASSMHNAPAVWMLHATYAEEAQFIARSMQHSGSSRVCVVAQKDAFGKEGTEAISAASKQYNLQIVAVSEVERTSKDAAVADKALLDGAKCDAYFIAANYVIGSDFVKRAKAKNIVGPFYALAAISVDDLLRQLGNQAGGVMVTEVVPSPYSAKSPAQLDFQRQVQPPYTFSKFEGWFAARAATAALEKLGANPTRSGLMSLLRQPNLKLDVDHIVIGSKGFEQISMSVLSSSGTAHD